MAIPLVGSSHAIWMGSKEDNHAILFDSCSRLIAVHAGKPTTTRVPCKERIVGRQLQMSMEEDSCSSSSSSSSSYSAFPNAEAYERLEETLNRIHEFQDPPAAYARLLKQCGDSKQLSDGKLIHAHIIRTDHHRDKLLLNLLIEMYGKCGNVETARFVFDGMRFRNVYSWTIMIVAYGENGRCKEALRLFREMLMQGMKPNKFTLTSILTACCDAGDLAEGKRIHASIADTEFVLDVPVCNSLVNMYGKCGRLEEARDVLDRMQRRDAISFTAMIEAYCQDNNGVEALRLFREMDVEGVKPCEISFLAAIEACARPELLAQGKLIHALVVEEGMESDPFLVTALITMYSRCGSLDSAKEAFGKLNKRDVVSWNAMISACVQLGNGLEALHLFRQMQQQGVRPCTITLVSILDACADVAALAQARSIEQSIICQEQQFKWDGVVATSLVLMYGKCGGLRDAKRVFDSMASAADVIAWTSLLAAYAQNGHSRAALALLHRMDHEGMKPNAVTFVSVLFACSHVGLVEDGCYYFTSMAADRGLEHTPEHYGCMIDLLGRAGWVEEAEGLMKSMPVQPDQVVLTSLLGAYRLQGGKGSVAAAKRFLQANDANNNQSGPFVLLSNMYGSSNSSQQDEP